MPVTIANRVIVRVWTSEDNQRFPGNNVGHISIETPEEYMSLWPVPFTNQQIQTYHAAGTLQQLYLKYFMERAADFKQNYLADYHAEEGIEPQLTICFYSLDKYAIEHKFHQLHVPGQHWRLVGQNVFFQTLETALEGLIFNTKNIESTLGRRDVHSCISLAKQLLIAGGINQLVRIDQVSTFLTRTSSVIAVDDILDVLIPAKLQEAKLHPETLQPLFIYPANPAQNDPGETPIAVLQPTKQGCMML